MECATLDAAVDSLNERLDILKASIQLDSIVSDKEELLEDINTDLSTVEAELQRLDLTIELGNEECDKAQQLLEALRAERTRLEYILETSLPAYVKDHPECLKQEVRSNGNSTTGANGAQSDANAVSSDRRRLCLRPLPAEQLSAVPRYIRGRITATQLSQFVDQFNAVLSARRQLFATARSALTSAQRKTLLACKRETLDETKGEVYIAESDFARFGGSKLGEPQRKMLMVLRHCKQLRQVRGRDSVIHHVLLRP